MNFEQYPISQSLIKEFFHNGEEKDICPSRTAQIHIFHHYHLEETESMLKGKFFETLCIGKSRKGEQVLDLPRKKLKKIEEIENRIRVKEGKELILGEKTIDQLRIETQAQRFRTLCMKYQIMVLDENTQVPIVIRWHKDPDVLITMELDIFPTPILLNEELSVAIIDLKLTADIHSTYGDYCYGAPHEMDLIQGKMYHYGIRKMDFELNPHLENRISDSLKRMIDDNKVLFLLWVFNYKKEVPEDKFIKIKWDPAKEAELHASIAQTVAAIEFYDKQGWPTNPIKTLCKDCPIFDCKDRLEIESI